MDSRGPFFSWSLPWRPPDLARFSRTSEFQELHTAADDWIERQFTHISANVEALAPAARLVSDYGAVGGTGGTGALNLGILAIRHGVFAHLRFSRQVAVAYGFDGPIPDRISDLLEVIEQGGWGVRLHKARAVNDPARPPRNAPRVRPAQPREPLLEADRRNRLNAAAGTQAREALNQPVQRARQPIREVPAANGEAAGRWAGDSPPPHRTLIAPGWADRPGPHQFPPGLVRVVWTSRTHPSRATLDVVYPATPDTREPWSYLGLETLEPIPPTDLSRFAAPALANHEHSVVVLIELDYYRALPGSTRPRDVPRRLVPRGR
jgi:hypothetical protein